MEKFLIEQGFKYDFYYEINDNEVMIANFKSSALKGLKEIYVLRINDERTQYFPASIIRVSPNTKNVVVRKAKGDKLDLFYVNCYDEENNSVCALIYDAFTRQNFYSSLFSKIYLEDNDFFEEDCESNLGCGKQLFCGRVMRIAKLNIYNDDLWHWRSDAFGKNYSEYNNKKTHEFLSNSALKTNINYDYYALLDEMGCVVRLFSSFKELEGFMYNNSDYIYRKLENYTGVSGSNLEESEKALSKVIDKILSCYGINHSEIVLKIYKNFHI